MRSALVLLVVAILILSACAPVAAPTATVPPAPNETPAPTATPAPTEMPTRTSTVTPTPIPTLPPEQVGGLEGVPDPRVTNPELFDLNDPDAPIPQLVNALKNAGIEGVTAEEVASNLAFEYRRYQRRDEDGNPMVDIQGNPVVDEYVFGVWELSADVLPGRYKELAGKIPVIYAQRTQGGWQWSVDLQTRLVPFRVFADVIGLKISTLYDSSDQENYLGLFNASLISNTAWGVNEPNRPNEFKMLNYVNSLLRTAKQRGAMPIYGGHLIYASEYPNWLNNGNFTNEELEQIVRDHIRIFMRTFPDIKIWNVVNELQSNWNKDDKIANQLGTYRLLEIAFEEARSTNQTAILVFNDSANHAFSGSRNAETEKDIAMIRFLRAKGLVDAIGVQMHINQNQYMPAFTREQFARVLQAYKDLGVQVYITELDVSLYNQAGCDRFLWQSQVYQDIFTTYLQSGVGNVINFWGVRDNTSWLETILGNNNADPLLFDDKGRVKLSYYIILKVLYQVSSEDEVNRSE